MEIMEEKQEYIGFIVHTYQQEVHANTVIYMIGRLANGETFGIVERREIPCFYVKTSDHLRVRDIVKKHGGSLVEAEYCTMVDEELLRVEHAAVRELRKIEKELEEIEIKTFEADLSFNKLYRINNSITGPVSITGTPQPGTDVKHVFINPELKPVEYEPDLRILSLDIETNQTASLITAVSLVTGDLTGKIISREVLVLVEPFAGCPQHIHCYHDEYSLLQAMLTRIKELDADIITGWNVINFDFRVILERLKAHNIKAVLGRSREGAYYREGSDFGGSRVTIPGRQVVDAMLLVRHSLKKYEDYKLNTVAQTLFGGEKLLQQNEDEYMPEVIERTRRENPQLFAEYCLEDSVLVLKILYQEKLADLNLKRSVFTGLPLDSAWGSVAAFDFLYLSELHKKGIIAPTGRGQQPRGIGAAGGLVLKPTAGIYRNIFVFDFKSLYPSIMRTFTIDPLAYARSTVTDDYITAPNGVKFARMKGILPEILSRFFTRRANAKQNGDELASYTYKIIMNSFYGVLGTRSCRFGTSDVAGAITSFGHHILKWSKKRLEEQGAKILYGDTDSLFVDAGLADDISLEEAGKVAGELCAMINDELAAYIKKEYQVESFLELEYEKFYRSFFLPPTRGSEVSGRAKGYAGLRLTGDGEQLHIVGMEAVRSDWTGMAHKFQRELLMLVLNTRSAKEIESFIADWVGALKKGEFDQELIYHKRLRKSVDSYTKTTPPHVKAARLLKKPSGTIKYVITCHGPEPVGYSESSLDYNHYIDKQVLPIVKTVAPFCNIDVDAAVHGIMRLF